MEGAGGPASGWKGLIDAYVRDKTTGHVQSYEASLQNRVEGGENKSEKPRALRLSPNGWSQEAGPIRKRFASRYSLWGRKEERLCGEEKAIKLSLKGYEEGHLYSRLLHEVV